MTDKETGELRRRYKPDRTNITAVYGCYVSGSGEILSEFRQPVALMSEEDKEKYLALVRLATNRLVTRLMMLNTGFGSLAIAAVCGMFRHWFPAKKSRFVFTSRY